MSLQQFDGDFEGGQGDALSYSESSRSSNASSSNRNGVQASPGRSPTSNSEDDFEHDKDTSSVFEKSHVSPVKKSPRKAKYYYHKGNEACMEKSFLSTVLV